MVGAAVRRPAVYFQVDNAWPARMADMETVDVREEAKALRFIASPPRIEAFATKYGDRFQPFTLTGSGDFHHLSAVWIRQFLEPFLLIAFDNHPDWVTSGPKWSCGAWVNRVLEHEQVRGISIWGCGSTDCEGRQIQRGRRALESGKLAVHPWRKPGREYSHWLLPTTHETWRGELADWAMRHSGEKIYISIDLDCLRAKEAVTNWDAGQFSVDDLAWALGQLRGKMDVIGGDVCGGWSTPSFAGWFQRFASWWDHPKAKPDLARREQINQAALLRLWPMLAGLKG